MKKNFVRGKPQTNQRNVTVKDVFNPALKTLFMRERMAYYESFVKTP